MNKETLLDKINKIIEATIGRLEYYFAKRWLDKTFGKREYWGDYITNLQQERERIMEEIEKERKVLTVFQNPKSTKQEREEANKLGYNQAIEDIIKTLKQ